uniref:Ribonuclease H-like domain-containing protein n=1 Tax=Tanacetum cinerariifolium TaxID=118510 RepID=A0A6L2JQE3_TANCI|nr:ribonuclease H-like domain-containing protein [Tanacetum cinerariifolium]
MDGSVIFNLVHKIIKLKQGELYVPKYYHTLISLWREFDIRTLLPSCTSAAHERVLKHNQLVTLMQFLIRLNDMYQPVRRNSLDRDPLHDVKDAFAIVSREESHRGLAPGKQSLYFLSQSRAQLASLYEGYVWGPCVSCAGISIGKEVNIRLGGGCDKALRPANMLLYSWDGGFDVCIDLTGSSPLTQIGMADFVPGQAMIDAAQRKRGKYMAKCAIIGYGFLPFSFSSLGKLEAGTVTLLKRIHKFPMTQDIGARAAIHILIGLVSLLPKE